MKLTTNKDMNSLIKEAIDQGWLVSKNKHLKWLAPTGGIIFTAATPSDHRAIKNIKRDLRREGFKTND